MEISFFFFSFLSYYHYFLLFISFIFVSNYLLFKKNKNRPPTPLALPILGHLHLINKPLPQALRDLSDRYGPILLLRFGSQSVLALSSPAAVEECLTKNDIIFANRPPVVAAKHIGYNYTSVEWSSYGPHWRNLRRLTNLEIFSSSSLQASSNIRNEEWIDYQGTEKKLKRVRKNKDDFLEGLIEEVKKRKMNAATKGDDDDERKKEMMMMMMNKTLIDALLALQEQEPKTYTHNIIKGVIGAMFSAGIETSLITMVASMSLLLKNPEALAKLRTELDLHIEEGRVISESDLPMLPYLQCVVNEALRLHPPAPIPLPHQSSQDCTIGGYDIPRGTMLLLNAWAIHRDPKVWEEPTKFKPERFEGFREDRMEGFKWIPFGSGRRGCPGSGMAMRVVSLAVGALIQCFEWRKVDDEMNVDKEEEEGAEPSPRAMYRPRIDKKDLLTQI
ncbi:Cytochrome P450 [Macleaya cordata]|uniref:Cytochrome P450 n=1 Tax=Macleaya cordata TaxID=56857 RepID=A0A200PV05_MACCD|nr:Cytochrome P450 [Macleaya cordata]